MEKLASMFWWAKSSASRAERPDSRFSSPDLNAGGLVLLEQSTHFGQESFILPDGPILLH